MSVWDKRAVSEWYDKYAKDKEEVTDDQIVSVPSWRYKLVLKDIEQLISLMNFSNEDSVLDAGCGAGRFIYRIKKKKNCQVFGIDTSRNMIKRAKKRTPEASYLIADILHLPFRSRAFTAVVCYSVLWHIPSERGSLFFNGDIYEKGLKEFKRVLEVDGKVLFNVSNPFHLQSIVEFFTDIIKVKLFKRVELSTYKMHLTLAKCILTKLGFKISDIVSSGYYPVLLETLYFPFHRFPSEKIISSYYDSFRRLEKFARGKNLRTFAHTFVIKAIKK